MLGLRGDPSKCITKHDSVPIVHRRGDNRCILPGRLDALNLERYCLFGPSARIA